jgi:hypothetical protein
MQSRASPQDHYGRVLLGPGPPPPPPETGWQTAVQAPHVPFERHACVPAVHVPLQVESHPQPCVAPEPLHEPADHWQLELHVSVSVPQLPQASDRVPPGAQTP